MKLILAIFPLLLISESQAKVKQDEKSSAETFKTELERRVDTRVYGGSKVFENKFKFMIHFLYSADEDNLSSWRCSTSLIKPDWVLLAAHCFQGCLSPRNSSVILVGGKADLNDYMLKRGSMTFDAEIKESEFDVQERRAKKIFVHQEYDRIELTNDIALVWAAKPFDIGPTIQVISLSYDKMTTHSSCTIVGWGDMENDVSTNILMYANGAVARSVEEGCTYHKRGNYICLVGGLGMGICPGDSGGPLICDGKVWGVASHSNISSRCGEVVEDFYTELYPYISWIEKTMEEPDEGSIGLVSTSLISDFALACLCIVGFFFFFWLTFFTCLTKMQWCCFAVKSDEEVVHYSRVKTLGNLIGETRV